ncbi:MAG: adenylate/guanylate cyclase domain-containing protein [Deltaproteobacteria bacterium]|nr:adenylate/guanylate cyclase domain-containing protein [Deltaproteobacteria bacterium]
MRLTFKSVKSVSYITPASITFIVIFMVITLFLSGNPILDMIELKTYDLRFRSRGHLQPTTPVVMALVDEKSLDAEGRWPWPRSKIATLVDSLSRDGAKVIGFDIGFLEPDANSQLALIRRLSQEIGALDIKHPKLEAFLKEHETDADNDLILATALKNSSAKIVLGYFFHMREEELDHRFETSQIEKQIEQISASKYPLVIFKDKDLDIDPFIKAYAPESNLEIFSRAAASAGYYSVRSDQDGVVRWMPLIIQCGEDLFPPLAVLCAWHYLDKPQLMVKVARYGVEGIQLGERFIPTDENGELLINFLGPPKTFPHISITDILNGRLAGGTFTDKIVLIGATAMGTHDLRSTPVSPLYPGVEIHATVIDNILTQDFITKPNWSKVFDMFAIVTLGVLTGLALPRMRAFRGLCFAVALFALHIIVARWLFVNVRAWLNIVFPLLVLSVNYTALTAYYYVTEEKERKRIKGTFRQYVAPLVIDELLKAPDRLKLGGEEKVLTVLFSDIAGFTTYSERYTPSEMIGILSDYYGVMTEQIFICQGTLKEYVGDEIMAFFGAPLEQRDHAQRACMAALAMRERRQALRAEWTKIGRPLLKARTGINSGPMLVGNLGSHYRFAYGVLGDQVNLGSRLEGLNKMYGTDILIGENTANLVRNDFLLREVDLVRVVGRQQCVRVYELVAGSYAALPKEQEQAIKSYGAGYQAYCEQRWNEALGFFNQGLKTWPDDGPSKTMAERCRYYQKSPPLEGWDCVYEPETK